MNTDFGQIRLRKTSARCPASPVLSATATNQMLDTRGGILGADGVEVLSGLPGYSDRRFAGLRNQPVLSPGR
jgi:hypothetical protein